MILLCLRQRSDLCLIHISDHVIPLFNCCDLPGTGILAQVVCVLLKHTISVS